MNFSEFLKIKTAHTPRAYINSAVRFHHTFSGQDRLRAARAAGWNVFQFPSEMLLGGDLLSDSGTTTLTSEQIAAMFLGDEAYGSNYGYFKLLKAFEETFGIPEAESEIFLFHQGRAAEHALFSQLGNWEPDQMIPSNGHFDTTRANIESNRMVGLDLFSPSLRKSTSAPFKGNIHLKSLENLLNKESQLVPMVYMTITNNTGGGQPVSMANLKAVRALCDQYEKPLFLDACRFAENAWFIQNRESGYAKKKIAVIVRELFALCDGFTISMKKDGLANMGGAIVIRKKAPFLKKNPGLINRLRDHQILVEGHPTYGGLSGRDIMVIAEGFKTVVTEEYLNSRIDLVHSFGRYLERHNVPVVTPFGGHAVYIDVNRFFADTGHKSDDFGGIALTGLLLTKGVRLCELGAFAFGYYDPKTKQEILPRHNFVRAAIPRNKYEVRDLLYVADCVIELHKRRHEIPRAVPIYGRDMTLRHFKARFKLEALTPNQRAVTVKDIKQKAK